MNDDVAKADGTASFPIASGLVCALEEAIATWVRPGMTLHIDPAAQAAVRALLRVFRGTRPQFTIVMSRSGTVAPDLVQAGLVRKLVAGGLVNAGVRPGASAAIQRAFRDGTVEFEHWSLYSMVLRFMAGALQWPFVPTRSIVGSSMATRNRDTFAEVADPFDDGPAYVAKSLVPDISLLHAACADSEGNAIFLPPFEGDLWGAKASRVGVLLSAEQVVPHETVRLHPHFAKLSRSRVRSVSQAPYSGHPYRVTSVYPELLTGYRQDSAFLKDYERAVGSDEAHERWLETWVYNISGHEAYLEQVGAERLAALSRSRARAGAPSVGAPRLQSSPAPASIEDYITLAAARRIVRRVLDGALDTLLVGNGLAALPCAVAYHLLRERGLQVQLVRGTGAAGWTPMAGMPEAELASAVILSGTTEAYGILVGGQAARSMAVLSAAQVDRFANLNSTELHSPRSLLTGSGGANDAASLTSEVIVVARFRRDRFVSAVDFTTAPGTNVSTVISDFGVLTKASGRAELCLTAGFFSDEQAVEEQLTTVERIGGWRIRMKQPLAIEPPATDAERTALALSRGRDDEGAGG